MLNVLLGMSAGGPWHAVNWVAAGGLGLYIVGVTIFARTEARPSGRQQLALGLIVSLAGIVLLASLPRWVTLREWPQIYVSANWNLFWGLMAALIGLRLLRAVVDPRPQYIQSAVRSAIFSLIILDAAVCLAAQDITRSAAILLLLVPTMILGRWVYST